jgi:hypothetical protein
MSLNVILDVTIGLMTMYLVLSLVCTSANEFISSLFKLRAVNLRDAMQSLIDDPNLRSAFNNHGLIAGAKKNQAADPSYISGPTFALALLDSLTPAGQVTTFAAAQMAAQALPPGNARDLILANIALANGKIEDLRQGLAKSFDRAMDRVSGVYKRQIKWISLLVGIGLAAALNADSITVAKALWTDKPRAQMLELAKDALAKGVDKESSVLGNGTMSPEKIADNYRAVVINVEEAANKLRPLPIGWDFSAERPSGLGIVLKVLGLVLTGGALMFGAPFWFDVLSKIMNLRFTGDKPARTAG